MFKLPIIIMYIQYNNNIIYACIMVWSGKGQDTGSGVSQKARPQRQADGSPQVSVTVQQQFLAYRPKSFFFLLLLSCCLTSTEARWPIRDGDRVGRGRESARLDRGNRPKKTGETVDRRQNGNVSVKAPLPSDLCIGY